MTTLNFEDADLRNLIDTLIEAVSITSATGERPSINVNGRVYAPFDLIKVGLLLSHNEDLQARHEAKVAAVFKSRQHGYRRTAVNLAHRANSIVADAKFRKRLA